MAWTRAAKWLTALASCVGVSGTLLMFAAQTPQAEAMSNVAGWLEWLGVSSIPAWLATQSTDSYVTAVGAAGLLAGGLWWIAVAIRSRRGARSRTAEISTPEPDHLLAKSNDARVPIFRLQAGSESQSPKNYDTPIWRAVHHVAASLDQDEGQNSYESSRSALRQAALDGLIRVRGKKEIDGNEGNCSSVHTWIDPSYWSRHELNPLASAEVWESHDHTFAENPKNELHRNRYWDLRVDMEKIRSQWKIPDALQQTRNIKPYLSDTDTGLTLAVILMVQRSAWGKWYTGQCEHYQDQAQRDNHVMLIATHLVVEAAMNGKLTIRGRPPDTVEFEPISPATWRLAALNVVPDLRTIWKVVVIPRDEVPRSRIARVLSFDSLIVNSREFESIWPAE